MRSAGCRQEWIQKNVAWNLVDPERDYSGKVQSVGSKVLIDATKPSLTHPARQRFARVMPTGWGEFDPEAFFPDAKPW